MSLFGIFIVLAIFTILPALLFLVQYRGRWRDPVALLLRGFTIVLLLRSASSLLFQAGGPAVFQRIIELIPSWLINLSGILQLASSGLLWFLYGLFLHYHKRPEANGL